MNMKLRHNCKFVQMYTNNLIKAFLKPLFDKNFLFKKKLKTSMYFYQMIKKTLSPSKYSMEEHFST
jgi:hypothetical protein